MDPKMVGAQIAMLRKEKGLTQNDLGERLGISFQAVSKWERGETLPDTGILLDLADVLGTTVDCILTGGKRMTAYTGKITCGQMAEGIHCLEQMGKLLGRDNLIYRSAVEGIDQRMNTQIEDCFANEIVFEAFLAEAIIQNLIAGKYVDVTDVKSSFRSEHFREIVLEHCARYGIK